MGAEELFQWLEIDKSKDTTDHEVLELLAGIVYFLLPESNANTCQWYQIKPAKFGRSSAFTYALGKYESKGNRIEEHGLEDILLDVNKTIGEHFLNKEVRNV